MAAPFGIHLTFEQLLRNLELVCGCTVVKQASVGDIIDPADSEAGCGDIYYVERISDSGSGDLRYAFVEVFEPRLPVLPDVLRSISKQLNLPVEKVINRGES